ncbi:phenylacetaldoxime dehydratase family protein [Aspergillus affinis]|uniref:phenylacetaldoxime dehydratase family protein n=1 Tax=Aspergillus affinis TaxID=1070780 RepID=UPI0022FE2D2F|nr:hem-containing dehydratase protein [Aspergillus affinis]KAI9034987.1 hem-containing dehydratase protein [Aspergillus affinis]
MECPVRKYPLRRPDGHKPPIPRWRACFLDTIDQVFTAYVGIQQHNQGHNAAAFEKCLASIEHWISKPNHAPASVERFRVLDGHDAPQSRVFVCYWADRMKYDDAIHQLDLAGIYRAIDLPDQQQTIGLWCERFTSHVSRLETNYTGTDYLPGLARLPDMGTQGHSYTGYWGAARDRIPDSANDAFEPEQDQDQPQHQDQHQDQDENQNHDIHPTTSPPSSLGKRLIGTNKTHNLAHIRSGQFWKHCPDDERRSYEENLEPTLRKGLAYLWQNPISTGSMALRYLMNVPAPSHSHSPPSPAAQRSSIDSDESSSSPSSSEGSITQSDESCVIGFFRNLSDLETWAKRHPSHLAIYTGAIRHAKTFGAERQFRTWHEVSVLGRGEAQFEYVNCLEGTGVIMGSSIGGGCVSLVKVDL